MSNAKRKFIIVNTTGRPLTYDPNHGGYLHFMRSVEYKNIRPNTRGRWPLKTFTAMEAKRIIKQCVEADTGRNQTVNDYSIVPVE